MKLLKRVLFIVSLSANLFAQSQFRVMAYNLYNYPNGQDNNFKIVLNQLGPDILIVSEMAWDGGVNQFLGNFTSSDYKAAPVIIKGTGTGGNDCAAYYRNSVFTHLQTIQHPTDLRDIVEFKFVHNISKDTLIVFGVHLKANEYNSDNVQNAARRATSTLVVRNRTATFNKNTNYIIAGDFNIFSSTEAAFQNLTDKSNAGYFIDPLNVTGNWTDNSSFAFAHTYSAKSLSTRLDMILLSEALYTRGGIDYMPTTFNCYGNDGNHYKKAVNTGSNYWFSDPAVGNALVSASDHLPVYADFYAGIVTKIEEQKEISNQFALEQNYPNPFNPSTTIQYQLKSPLFVTLKIYDLLGREVETLVNDYQKEGIHFAEFRTQSSELNSAMVSGIYFYRLAAGDYSQTKIMFLMK